MAKADIPVIVKHCALAVFRTGDMAGTKLEQLRGAFAVARSRLTQYGFLMEGSQKGGTEAIKLTAKGHKREAVHKREKFGHIKTIIWDLLYTLIQEDVEDEGETEAETAVDDQPQATPAREALIEKKRRRLAKVARSASPKRRPRRKKRAKRG